MSCNRRVWRFGRLCTRLFDRVRHVLAFVWVFWRHWEERQRWQTVWKHMRWGSIANLTFIILQMSGLVCVISEEHQFDTNHFSQIFFYVTWKVSWSSNNVILIIANFCSTTVSFIGQDPTPYILKNYRVKSQLLLSQLEVCYFISQRRTSVILFISKFQ